MFATQGHVNTDIGMHERQEKEWILLSCISFVVLTHRIEMLQLIQLEIWVTKNVAYKAIDFFI